MKTMRAMQVAAAGGDFQRVSGIAMASEATPSFSVLGVRAKIEAMPLERANEGYARMLSAEARFRSVLTTGL